MERIFIEVNARPVRALSPLALVLALLVHVALLPFVLLSFNPPQLEETPPTVVEVTFLELSEVPEDERLTPPSDPPPLEEAAAPAIVAVPDINLPQTTERSAEERAAAEALSGYLCIFSEENEEERADCEARRQARALMQDGAQGVIGNAVLAENLFTRLGVSLGLMSDPSQVPPVDDPARDPYAPDDKTYENPIDSIRDPIPGVTHH